MAELTLGHVTKRFGDVTAVDDVTLDVRDGELVALLGPSGCGKTTILRLIAGFESVSAGEIRFDGELMSAVTRHVPPERRRVGIVFQSYALWPHMSVGANVGYPLRVARVSGEEYRSKVEAALETVGLTGLGSRRPADLSGGQRQRVALARCLVMEPSLVLLDEPLANLDVHLRAAMEEEFVDFHGKTGATMLYITHDQAEAMALADRVAVMDDGRLVQVADPHTLYEEPATTMVADFIGQGSQSYPDWSLEPMAMVLARSNSAASAWSCAARGNSLRDRPACRCGRSSWTSRLRASRAGCGASSTAAVSMTSRFTCPALRDTRWC